MNISKLPHLTNRHAGSQTSPKVRQIEIQLLQDHSKYYPWAAPLTLNLNHLAPALKTASVKSFLLHQTKDSLDTVVQTINGIIDNYKGDIALNISFRQQLSRGSIFISPLMTLTADTVSAYLLVFYYVTTTTSVLKALAERGACFHFHHKVCAP